MQLQQVIVFFQPVNACFWCFSYVCILSLHNIQEHKSAETCIKLVLCIQLPVFTLGSYVQVKRSCTECKPFPNKVTVTFIGQEILLFVQYCKLSDSFYCSCMFHNVSWNRKCSQMYVKVVDLQTSSNVCLMCLYIQLKTLTAESFYCIV